MNFYAVCTRTYLPVCRYRLSSGSGDTSSSEEDRYDRKEAKIYGNSRVSSSNTSKAPDTTVKVPATEGNNSYIGIGNNSIVKIVIIGLAIIVSSPFFWLPIIVYIP